MAKKSAANKKKVSSNKKATKSSSAKSSKKVKESKSVLKSAVKAVKSVAKVLKISTDKKAKEVAVKPALMTKKGKAQKPLVLPVENKTKTVVSLIESESQVSDQIVKVEKTSKVKPVKVDRGNLADEKAKWTELFKKYGKEKAANYKMTEQFGSLIPLQHKVLGWGFILTNENDRLEVLFENGIRMLISNYKS